MAERAPDPGLFVAVLQTLERLKAPYMVVGAFAATIYGLRRATLDIDIVVDLDGPHIEALAAAFPPPRYYADAEQMRDSILHGTMFNILDTTLGEKADLVPVGGKPQNRQALLRRVRQSVDITGNEPFDIWCARVEDIVVGKLGAWAEGRSGKHERDIYEMLVYGGRPTAQGKFDFGYVDAQAWAMGEDVYAYWRSIRRAAQLARSE